MKAHLFAALLWVPLLFFGAVGVAAQADAAGGGLRLAWTGVTVGALSAPPLDVSTSDGPFMLIATEDRRVRLVDHTGETVSIANTGMRRPAHFIRERPGVFLLISDTYGSRERSAGPVGDAAIVRVRVAGGAVRTVGSPGEGGRGIVEHASFVSLDGEGNLYSFTESGLAGHGSTAGAMLWQRALPGGVTTIAGGGEGVYAALRDGRVFRFDGGGEGRPIVHWPATIVDMAVAEGDGGANLLIEDDTGRLSLVALNRDPRTLWSLDRLGGTTARSASIVSLPTAVATRDGSVRLMGSSATPAWTMETRSPIAAVEPVHDGGGYALLDTDNRLSLVDALGEVIATLRLTATPTGMWWLPEYRRLVIAYPDWRMQVFAADGPGHRGATPAGAIGASSGPSPFSTSSADPPGTGALVALARTVLAGRSVVDRRALLDRLRTRLDDGALYGAVADYRYILGELLREVYRDPRLEGGIVVNNARDVRLRAVAALGVVPDRASRVILTRSVRFDPDVEVAAAALSAIARYGVDEFGAFPRAVERFATGSAGERATLAQGMVDFLEYTAVGVEDPALAERAIDLVARSSVPRDLRARAVRLGR